MHPAHYGFSTVMRYTNSRTRSPLRELTRRAFMGSRSVTCHPAAEVTYSLLPPEKLVLDLAAGICRKTELAKDAFKVSKARHKKIENKPHFHCSPSQPNTITTVTILSVYSALCENVTSSAKPEVGLRSALYYRQRKTELQSHQSHYSAPDREAGYCDERVCLCVRVCVSVCLSTIISSELHVRSS